MQEYKKQFWKNVAIFTVIGGLFTSIAPSQLHARTKQENAEIVKTMGQSFGEWYYNTQSNPPTLTWWNDKMPMVPVLYISFEPNKIVLNAITPVWPDTGIIFYIRDKTDKYGVNLTLNKKDQEHCYYTATIDDGNRQSFVNNLVTSRKARLITPSSYSQSLSLKHVYQGMNLLLSTHPELNLTLPSPSLATK